MSPKIRWNTTFQIFDRLTEHQAPIDTVVRLKLDDLNCIQINRLKSAALTLYDWDILCALHHMLMKFNIATTVVSPSHNPTLSDLF